MKIGKALEAIGKISAAISTVVCLISFASAITFTEKTFIPSFITAFGALVAVGVSLVISVLGIIIQHKKRKR